MKITKKMKERLAQIIIEHTVNNFEKNRSITKESIRAILDGYSVDYNTGEVRLHIPVREADLWRRRIHKKGKIKNPKIQTRAEVEKIINARKELIKSFLSDAVKQWQEEFEMETEVF